MREGRKVEEGRKDTSEEKKEERMVKEGCQQRKVKEGRTSMKEGEGKKERHQ